MACAVTAVTRLDVNVVVRKRLGVKKASFASADETREMTGMMIGGVTALALPEGLALWVDAAHPWLMVYTADDQTDAHRRAVAVEPMTAQADAFRSGEDLLMLDPDQEFSATWGIHVLD